MQRPAYASSSHSHHQSLTDTIHRTTAASEKPNDLYCYACHSMYDGDICVNNITANYSSFAKKCNQSEFTCMVKRFSYTTSTENATSQPSMWSLERRCAANCEAGCIVIGERTKLYACTTCCNTSYCNSGRGRAGGTRLHGERTGWMAGVVAVVATALAYGMVADCGAGGSGGVGGIVTAKRRR